MTLQQMRYFIMVAESGSISEAAKRLYAAQSSVSSAIKEIESFYGVAAFLRDSKGVWLTKEGEELLIEFKGVLNRLDYLEEKYTGKHYSHQGFSVSAQHHICGIDSFISVVNRMTDQEYKFGFHECKTSEVLERVEKGMDDLGIIFFAEQSKGQMVQELRNRGLIFNHISYKKAHVYISRNHPLAAEKEIHMEQLVKYPFITYDRTADANPAYTEVTVPHFRFSKMIAVSDRAAAYSLLRQSEGFVVGSGYHSSDECYNDILTLPVYHGARLEVGWIVKNKFILTETAEQFVDLLLNVETGEKV